MSVLVTRLVLRNYKSIAKAVVDLSDLTVLVGPNGVGKSNLIDALRFVADSLNTTLDLAMRQRGGIGEVRRHSGGHPNHFTIAMYVSLAGGRPPAMRFRSVRRLPAALSCNKSRQLFRARVCMSTFSRSGAAI
jgi:hypothetical protein